MIPREWLKRLVASAMLLPIALVLLLAAARLFAALGDAPTAFALDRLALVGGLVWISAIIGLVIALAQRAVDTDQPLGELPEELEE